MMRQLFPVVMLLWPAVCHAGEASLLPDGAPAVVADVQDSQIPDRVHLSGMIGTRIDRSVANRLLTADLEEMLAGFRHRPGVQVWCGEHLGKWLHAGTLAWVNTGDERLRARLDYAVDELLKCQLDDGYLGTYLPKDNWTEWDVWVHKYDLIGLIAYMRHTRDTRALPACRRIADLLCNTFGDAPGKRDIIAAGHQAGMAPTSVLEPMALLYRLTGEPRYRDFCEYILRSWEQPNGPHIVSRLLAGQGVDKVGNGKAYEMLSCINGVLEWYRVTGDRQFLQAAENAWADIVAKRLYLTGTASYYELFHDDFNLPNIADVGETCVTVTWLQFNAQLLRLTGEAKYAEQLERVVYNQLCGAQRPDGAIWGYYVQMEGKKPYNGATTCCLSSGPRGMAMIPTFAITTDADGVVVNLYDAGNARLRLRDGAEVLVGIDTIYPAGEKILLAVDPASDKPFAVKLRIPEWCPKPSVKVNGEPTAVAASSDGYAVIRRSWRQGDKIELILKLEPRLVLGDHTNQGKAAVLYGPLVLAADAALSNDKRISSLKWSSDNLAELAVTPEPAPGPFRTWPHAQAFRVNALVGKTSQPMQIRLVPFADAGSTGELYKVWLPLAGSSSDADNLLGDGAEGRSRRGNVDGSVLDGRYVVTFDGNPAKEDWYAVTLDRPVAIKHVVFKHGKTFHDGGWFDASGGKPQVQTQTAKDGPWQTIGELVDYPATTAVDPAGLTADRTFHCELADRQEVFGVRVIGKPACGDNSHQAFSSCGGLIALPSREPTPLIFDTDMGNDIDDALALSLIHALQSQGECKLLAVTLTKDNRYAGPFVNLVNTFYGRGDIPIGVVRNGFTPEDSRYITVPSTTEDDDLLRYPHDLLDGRNAPEATSLLRKTLAGQPDHSVVIVQVGFSTNLARLLDSKPDDVSPLDGATLVRQKVRLLSAMAGKFAPDAKRFAEYNVVTDLASAKRVFADWPTPIVFSGFEIGEGILFPGRSIAQDYGYVAHHPIAEAYALYMPMPYDRPTWDLTAVLHAVRPEAGYFGLSPAGRVVVEADGATRFEPKVDGMHRHLIANANQAKHTLDTLVELCRRPPDANRSPHP